MIAEAIAKVQSLANAAADTSKIVEVVHAPNGKPFRYSLQTTDAGSRDIDALLTDPDYPTLKVSTLTGFLDSLQALPAPFSVEAIHVADHLTVEALGPLDYWNRRPVYIRAKHNPITAFQFDTYYSEPEKFIIALQVAFLRDEALQRLITYASRLRAGSSVETEDSGFAQTLTIKTGEVSTADIRIEPIQKLAAIRTFAEVNPAFNQFLVRFQGSEGKLTIPKPALFNVDGSKWQLDTALAIQKYLRQQLDAQNKPIPVIA